MRMALWGPGDRTQNVDLLVILVFVLGGLLTITTMLVIAAAVLGAP